MDHNDSEDEQEEGQGQAALTGFLFGNIDKKGKLEDDVLDEDSKRHLNGLSALGMSSMVAEITEDTEKDSQNGDTNDAQDVDIKSETAVDYSDINEVAEEEELSQYRAAMANMQAPKTDDEDYDEAPPADDKRLMPPPTWVPGQPPPQQTSVSNMKEEESDDFDKDDGKRPLAAMLPQELADKNVQDFFPEFRPNQVLRFSRLFKPTYMPHVWRRKKKKLEDEGVKKEEKADGTSEKKEGEKSEKNGGSEAPVSGVTEAKSPDVDKEGIKIKEEPAGEDDDSFEDYCPFQLNLGRDPRPDELDTDDAEVLVQPIKTKKKKVPTATLR